ncbi:MAG: SBBP repeat-containing protein, partial [Candidatus Bathyarchaeia archaeon]
MKNEYRVKPGAKPEKIRFSFEGAKKIRVDNHGGLEVMLEGGVLKESAPISYQIIEGRRVEVKTKFRVDDSEVMIESDAYINDQELIIGPLIYSTYLGGIGSEVGYSITIDKDGNACVAGYTSSSDFPTTPGVYDSTHNGNLDVFITKLNSTGTSLIFSTYLGGADNEFGWSVEIDGDGNVYVSGYSGSADFPVTEAAFDKTLGGTTDVFVTKINASGTSLIYSTFLGGSSGENECSMVIDANGNAYVTGWTLSVDFPVTAGAYDKDYNGSFDIFITKLNSSGTSLQSSTYLGGSASEWGNAIALDGYNNGYITGYTTSSNFPVTAGVFDTSYNGGGDAFIIKLDSAGASLIYSTYLGGSSGDEGTSIAVDTTGNAYIAGHTESTFFPVTAGAFDLSYNGLYDIFITKINANATSLIYSTYLGGSGDEWDEVINKELIALDESGNVYLTGYTNSIDFPVTAGAYDITHNGGFDVFITKVNCAGTSLSYSTYLGGSSGDKAQSIVIDQSGNVFVTGVTGQNFPVTAGAFDTTYNGSVDAFICKISIESFAYYIF